MISIPSPSRPTRPDATTILLNGRTKAFAILLGACLLAYLPVIVAVASGNWPFSDDSLTLFNEWRIFGNAVLRSGALPLWNPHIFTGEPLLANNQSAFLYPPNLVYLVLPLPWAMISDALVHTLLLGCGGYALLRALRLGRPAALFGGLCLMMGTSVVAHANNGHFSWTAARAYLPWELYTLLLLLRTGQRRYAVGLGIVAAASLAAGYPPIALLGAALCIGLLIAWVVSHRALFRRQVWGGLFLAGALAVLLSAVYVLPLLEMSRASTHGTGLEWEFATNFSGNIRTYVRVLMPLFFGNNDMSWGSVVPHEECGAIGTLSLLLALLAPWLARRGTSETPEETAGQSDQKRNSVRRSRLPRAVGWLWALLPFAILMAAGRNSEIFGYELPSFYGLMWDILPPLHSTRVPVRWMELWYLVASLLAAFSLDALLERARQVRPGRPETLLRVALWTALLLCSSALIWVMMSTPQAQVWQSAGEIGNITAGVKPAEAAIILHDYAGLQAVLSMVWAGAALLLLRMERSPRSAPSYKGAQRLAAASTGLVVLELLALFWQLTKSIPPEVRTQYVWPAAITQHYQPGTRWDTSIANNSMNEAMRTGLDIWGGYDALSSSRYFKFAAQLERRDPQSFWSAVYQGIARRPLLRVAGVTHILQNQNFADPNLQRLRNSGQVVLEAQNKPWTLWRLTDPRWKPWPRVYLTSDVHRATEPDQLDFLDVFSTQPQAVPPVVADLGAFPTVVDASTGAGTTLATGKAMDRVLSWQRGTNRFSVICQTTRPTALVVSEANWAGWHAWVNGQPARLESANYLFRGVTVNKGTSRVTLVYEPQILRFSAFLTLCGLMWLSAWLMARPRSLPKEY